MKKAGHENSLMIGEDIKECIVDRHFTTTFTLFPPILTIAAVPVGRRLTRLAASL